MSKWIEQGARYVEKPSRHEEFAVRGHLLRWCHERSDAELRALQAAFKEMTKAKAKGQTLTPSPAK